MQGMDKHLVDTLVFYLPWQCRRGSTESTYYVTRC